MIVAEAIHFFADEGFDGQIRALAERIGITHSVLFRHFPSKDALIERVYQTVYVDRMKPDWTAALKDRSRPLEARLLAFYREYTAAIFHRDWIRIFMFAGLRGVGINAPYLRLLRETVLLPICAELRAAFDDGSPPDSACTDDEIERAWSLHGRIFYLAIRKFVYGVPIPANLDQTIEDAVFIFLRSAAAGATARKNGLMTAARRRIEGVRMADSSSPVQPVPITAPLSFTPRRMPPKERERQIVEGAVSFFAEHGMDGQMRQLALRLGITHPLLYRYFPTKDALIEQVYETVYLSRWNPEWDVALHDTARPLPDRLAAFYAHYAAVIDHYDWIRIFVFAGLHGVGICRRYLDLVAQRIIEPVAAAIGIHRSADASPGQRDREIAWGLHGQIVYVVIRRWIYEVPSTHALAELVADAVADVIAGVKDLDGLQTS